MPCALLLCGYWGSEPRSSYLCGSHHVPFPWCLPLQSLTLWFCLHKTLQSCLFEPLGTMWLQWDVTQALGHWHLHFLVPEAAFPHGILNRRVQQQTEVHWPQLKGISPCWAAVENKKVIIIAWIKSAQDGDLRRAFKTSWPPATLTPPPTV